MNTVGTVVSILVIVVLFFGAVYFACTTKSFPKTLRVQNDVPFTLEQDKWTRMPATAWITPGDGITFEDGVFRIDDKYTGALVTVNVQATTPVDVRFVGIGNGMDITQGLGIIEMFGSQVWQVQNVNNLYAIELLSVMEDTEVILFRIGIQVNR